MWHGGCSQQRLRVRVRVRGPAPQTQGACLPWATAARLLLGLRRCGDLPILWMVRLRLREARAPKASACELDPGPSFILGCRVVNRADGRARPARVGGAAGTGLSRGVGDGWVQGQTLAEDRQSHQGTRPVPSASGPGFPLLGEEGRQQKQLRAGEGRNAHSSAMETWAPHSGFPFGWALRVPGGQTAQKRGPVGFTV